MTDRDITLRSFIAHLIGGYTIDMSKSNQSVQGFFTFTVKFVSMSYISYI